VTTVATNEFLKGIGLKRGTLWLNSLAPSWLNFQWSKNGIICQFTPNSEYVFQGTKVMRDKNRIVDWVPVDSQGLKGEFLELSLSYGRAMRRMYLDSCFYQALDLSFGMRSSFGSDRFRRLTDDDEDAVLGIANDVEEYVALQWLHPRWLIIGKFAFNTSGDGGYDARRKVMMESGDVEKNPGPFVLNCLWALSACLNLINVVSESAVVWFDNVRSIWVTHSPWLIESIRRRLYDVHFAPHVSMLFRPLLMVRDIFWISVKRAVYHFILTPIDALAYDCAVRERENEYWLNIFGKTPVTRVAKLLGIVTPPEMREVDLNCQVAYYLRGKPDVPAYIGSPVLDLIRDVLIVWLSLVALSVIASFVCFVAYQRRKYVRGEQEWCH